MNEVPLYRSPIESQYPGCCRAESSRDRRQCHSIFQAQILSIAQEQPEFHPGLSSYTEVYLVIQESGSVPRRTMFSPRETSAENPTANQP